MTPVKFAWPPLGIVRPKRVEAENDYDVCF